MALTSEEITRRTLGKIEAMYKDGAQPVAVKNTIKPANGTGKMRNAEWFERFKKWLKPTGRRVSYGDIGMSRQDKERLIPQPPTVSVPGAEKTGPAVSTVSVPGMIRNTGLVYDLSNPEDLKDWNTLVAMGTTPDALNPNIRVQRPSPFVAMGTTPDALNPNIRVQRPSPFVAMAGDRTLQGDIGLDNYQASIGGKVVGSGKFSNLATGEDVAPANPGPTIRGQAMRLLLRGGSKPIVASPAAIQAGRDYTETMRQRDPRNRKIFERLERQADRAAQIDIARTAGAVEERKILMKNKENLPAFRKAVDAHESTPEFKTFKQKNPEGYKNWKAAVTWWGKNRLRILKSVENGEDPATMFNEPDPTDPKKERTRPTVEQAYYDLISSEGLAI